MIFNRKELSAILKMAIAMVMADGKVHENETKVMTLELLRFGVPESQVEDLLRSAAEMELTEALAVLTNLDNERKKYVSSYLGLIMIADGDVDESETTLWKFVSTICKFPTMSIGDAVKNMAEL